MQTTLHKDIFEVTNSEILIEEELVIERSPIEKLKEAKELLDLGILSEYEFLKLKKQIPIRAMITKLN